MPWRAELGGQFLITRDGVHLGPAPSRTVAILLVGLLSRSDGWSSRSEISQLLYTEKDSSVARAALRQALSRLRDWLGDDAIQADADRIRLSEAWTCSLDLVTGNPASGARIAPGLEHPWMDQVRRDWRRSDAYAAEPHDAFVNAVLTIAPLDRNDARAILVGGHALIPALTPNQIHDLLAATRPTKRLDPHVSEYLEIKGFYDLCSCDLESACISLSTAYDLAVEQKKVTNLARIAAFGAFACLEKGNIKGSSNWLARIGTCTSYGLLAANIQATDAWSRNRFEEALNIIVAASKTVKTQDRRQQVHFWANFAVLAAEAGKLELSEEAEARCLESVVPELDFTVDESLLAASAIRYVARRHYDEALQQVSTGSKSRLARRWPMSEIYYDEIAALAHVGRGDLTAARRTWSGSVAARAEGHGTLTPRLKARAQQIRAGV